MPILEVSSGKHAHAIMAYCVQGHENKELAYREASSILDCQGSANWKEALERFKLLDRFYPNKTRPQGNKGYWMVSISFDPDDPKTKTLDDLALHTYGADFMNRALPGHEYVGFVHRDKAHPHLHLVIHPVNLETGERLDVRKRNLHEMKEISHGIAHEKGLWQVPLGKAMEREPKHVTGAKLNLKGEENPFIQLKRTLNEAKTESQDWTEYQIKLARSEVSVSRRGKRCSYQYCGKRYTSNKLGEAYSYEYLAKYFAKKDRLGPQELQYSFEAYLKDLGVQFNQRRLHLVQKPEVVFEQNGTHFKVFQLADGSWRYLAYRGEKAFKGDFEETHFGRQIPFRISPTAEESKRKMAANLVDLRSIAAENGWKLRQEGRFWVGSQAEGRLSLIQSRRGAWHFKWVPEEGKPIRGKGLEFGTRVLGMEKKTAIDSFSSRHPFEMDAFQRAMYGDLKKLLLADRFREENGFWKKGDRAIQVTESGGKQFFRWESQGKVTSGNALDYLVQMRNWHPFEGMAYLQKRTFFPHEEDRARFVSPTVLREYGYQVVAQKGHWILNRNDESQYVCRPTRKGWWIQGENIVGPFRGNLLSFGTRVLREERHVFIQKWAAQNEMTPEKEVRALRASLDKVAYGMGFRFKNKALGPEGVWLQFERKPGETVFMRPDENGKWIYQAEGEKKDSRQFVSQYGKLEGVPATLYLERFATRNPESPEADLAFAKAGNLQIFARKMGFKGSGNELVHPTLGSLNLKKTSDGWSYSLAVQGRKWEGDGVDFAMRFGCLTRSQAIQTLGGIVVGRAPELPKWGEALSQGLDIFLNQARRGLQKNDADKDEEEREKPRRR